MTWNSYLVKQNRLASLAKMAEKTIGKEQTCPTDILYMHVLIKAQAILCTVDHPLCTEFQIAPRARTKRIKDYFLAVIIWLMNSDDR
ncbi:hypothetical protein PDJAM_G00054200 [Pangasius djambal]|uniref:Uncharacterized protein n=1 Tax=Pangasius djambal TaxID=1691987 RepID=A0ACC5YWR2_9TELE|nr:hypothetical protein [Pangasius djambal]